MWDSACTSGATTGLQAAAAAGRLVDSQAGSYTHPCLARRAQGWAPACPRLPAPGPGRPVHGAGAAAAGGLAVGRGRGASGGGAAGQQVPAAGGWAGRGDVLWCGRLESGTGWCWGVGRRRCTPGPQRHARPGAPRSAAADPLARPPSPARPQTCATARCWRCALWRRGWRPRRPSARPRRTRATRRTQRVRRAASRTLGPASAVARGCAAHHSPTASKPDAPAEAHLLPRTQSLATAHLARPPAARRAGVLGPWRRLCGRGRSGSRLPRLAGRLGARAAGRPRHLGLLERRRGGRAWLRGDGG
jgi:hypothetical protein